MIALDGTQTRRGSAPRKPACCTVFAFRANEGAEPVESHASDGEARPARQKLIG